MGISLIGPLWMLLLVAALVGAIVWCVRSKSYASLSCRSIATSIMPGVVMVGTFYPLALHMHATLGGWRRRTFTTDLTLVPYDEVSLTIERKILVLLSGESNQELPTLTFRLENRTNDFLE